MGNILGLKEQKNSDRGNIRMCEKRYGYNLNDLHSYIYKINLPLKPAYIKYILEDKKKKNYTTQEENEKKENRKYENNQGEEDREKEEFENANDNFVDIYKTYEKNNINNANNIYKNKLILNKENNIEKIEDKHIHLFYNPNYKCDKNKNNIYTEETISDYIATSREMNNYKKIEEQDKPEQKQEQEQCHGQEQEPKQKKEINKQKETHAVQKTYINMCLNYYNNLNTCVIKKYEKNVQNKKYKFTRLHTCKPHYVMFSRCIHYRDKKLMQHIKKLELKYFRKLSDESKSAYLNEFLTELSYHEYLINKLYDGVEKIKLNKELHELRERYNHILKESELIGNIKKQGNKKDNKKQIGQNYKPILLNIQ